MMQATPLHIASRNNYLDIASALLRAGAKLDLKDSDGKVLTVGAKKVNCLSGTIAVSSKVRSLLAIYVVWYNIPFCNVCLPFYRCHLK